MGKETESGSARGIRADLRRAMLSALHPEGALRSKWFSVLTHRATARALVCGPLWRTAVGSLVLRKEVIQPQVLLRLPCYDLVPVAGLTVGRALPPKRVRLPTSRAPSSRGLTGGVYKARAHIHRSEADLRLLAIPASRGRIAAPDPNWDRL